MIDDVLQNYSAFRNFGPAPKSNALKKTMKLGSNRKKMVKKAEID